MEADHNELTILIPDVLGGSPPGAEGFLNLLPKPDDLDRCEGIMLDLARVSWVYPYGVILLLETCHHLHRVTGSPVRLTGIREEVHAYLRRVDFFTQVGGSAREDCFFDESNDWGRSSASSNVLELHTVSSAQDIYAATRRARDILGTWLMNAGTDVDRIVGLLSEACGNAADHSRDIGLLTIQKYEHQQYTEVRLAIGDGGQGIQRSLSAAHKHAGRTDLDYIAKAMEGLSSRPGGRGGLGLGGMRDKAVETGGSFYIRSGTGGVRVTPAGSTQYDDLAHLPGTQVAITFRSHY